jgi:hypothetical protein
MNISGNEDFAIYNTVSGDIDILEPIENKVQNIDEKTTNAGTTNFLGVLELNGVPISDGSIPQPYPGNFDVIGSVNALSFITQGGNSSQFVKGNGGLDLNTYVKTSGDTMTGNLTCPSFIKTGGTNIEYLMGDGSTLTQSATSGNSNFYLYNNTNSTTDTTPVSGEVIINSLANTTATIVYISHVTRDNIDVEVFWKFVNTLTELYLQDQSLSTNYIQYNITSAPTITIGDKIAIPVSVANSAGTGSTSFGVGHNILVSFFTNNLEVDTRISALETKTVNQSSLGSTTLFNGQTLIREASGVVIPHSLIINCDGAQGPRIIASDNALVNPKPLELSCSDFNLNCSGYNNIRCAAGQNIALIGNVNNTGYSTTSNSFITNGGLSTQFVKGNGTLDSSTYLTSAALTTLETKTQNLTAIANTTTNTGLFTSGSLAVSNGTSSTLITTTSGTAALPLILPSIQASTGQILQGSSTGQTSWASVVPLKGVRFFNVAGSTIYTPTAGTTRALVICCGAGGAGGGIASGFNNNYGGGGNAGGQAIGYFVIDETKTGSISLGVGGTGVTGGQGNGGTATTFLYPSTGTPNATISGAGAFGGGTKQGTTDDRMATANINVVSGTIPALNAVLLSGYTIGGNRGGYGFSTAGDTAISGIGANSAFGVGGQEIYINNVGTISAGNAGSGNGSGGGGAISTVNGSAAGGAGRLGCILIYEY